MLVHLVSDNMNNMNFPFSSINNVELNNLHCSDTMNFLKSLPNLEIVSEVANFSAQLSEFGLNMAYQTDCKYCSVK